MTATSAVEAALRALAPHATPSGFALEGVRALLAGTRAPDACLEELSRAMTKGLLTPQLWRAATGAAVPTDFTVAFAELWDALADAGLVHEAEGMPQAWTPASLRLWGYTANWLLLSQDEDLMLMRERDMPALLELCADLQCPKRDYVLGIVAHWARDEAYAALGAEHFADQVARIAVLAPAARGAQAPALADYFLRLASYALPARVDAKGALQRALDLTRCCEPTPDAVAIERRAAHWLVTLPSPSKLLRIAASDGQIAVLPQRN